MKAFSFPALATILFFSGAGAWAGEDPIVAGPYTELRKSPLFQAETLRLARTWGPAIPVGTGFQVEKVYGRWIYGKPAPLANMKAADFAPSGWIYTRSLLIPGDHDTLSPEVLPRSRAFLYHARVAWKKLGMGKEPLLTSLDFLENLALSEKTLAAFSRPEQAAEAQPFSLLPLAQAAETEEPAPLGLTGSDFHFLDQEIHVIQTRKKQEAHQRELRHLKPPPPPPLDDAIRRGILGRYMLERYLELPPLTMEEADGFIYMRATAMRALRGCPKEVQNFWKIRRWNFFRVYGLKSRPEQKHPWLETAFPGGYFAVSGRAIALASNEAELAFLLVRQLVRELKVKRVVPSTKKNWPTSLVARSESYWDQVLKAQSTKDSENLDVSDEIEVDLQAAECLGRSGYRPMAALAYLRKLGLNREEPWAQWFAQHAIGLDYRIDRLQTLTQEAIAHQKFPDGPDSQSKRFASAVKQWNILP